MRFGGCLFALVLFLCSVLTSQAGEYLIWNVDSSASSAPFLANALVAAGYSGAYTSNINTYVDSLPEYRAIFICLGTFPNNGSLSAYPVAVDSLVSYLANYAGTNIYMEGGDVWFSDPVTALHPYFHIQGVVNGAGDTDTVLGQAGTFTEGMVFAYAGDNASMDQIAPLGTAFTIFANGSPPYVNGVAYNDGGSSYRTVGTSFEFGGLMDSTPPSTRLALVDSIMHFFRIVLYDYDVGPRSIDSPLTELCPNEPIFPQATVRNYGKLDATGLNVTCEIDSQGVNIYSDTEVVSLLPPNGTVQVSFDQWAPDGYGNCYVVTFYTVYAPDTNYTNDTLSVTSCTFGFGDSLDSVSFPGLGPQALAGITYCSGDWRFYLVNKNDKYVYRLNPNGWSIEQAFQTANPGTEAPWGISWDGTYFWVSAVGPDYCYDRQYAYEGNNTGYYVDMRTATGCDWAAGMDFDRKYTRQVSFGGTGAVYRLDLLHPTDPVLDSIQGAWSSGTERGCCYIPYTHEVLTGGMNSGILYKVDADDGAVVEQVALPLMADLDIFDLGIRAVDTLHALVTLEDVENTIVKIALGLRRPLDDLATISIDSPSGNTVYDSVLIRATVANWGKASQTGVWVSCSVTAEDSLQPEWVDSLQVSLASGDEQLSSFGWWMPRHKDIYYLIRVETHLIGDELPYNDDLTKTVYSLITIHDGGVLHIFAPPDTVHCDSTYIPIVSVKNFGDWTESFDVTCAIDTYVDTARVNNLPSGGSVPVTFAPWTAPSSDSSQCLMTVTTLVAGDHNPFNDSLAKSIFVRRAVHDVGVDSILSPPDSVFTGGTYAVSALIHNYGNVSEDSFRVRCTIDGHEDSVWVYRLTAGYTVQVDFPDSFQVFGPGPWVATVYTLAPEDNNSANDSLSKTIYLVGVEELAQPLIPRVFGLSQGRPNPFSNSTTIRYSVQGSRALNHMVQGRGAEGQGRDLSTCHLINLSVYDASGRLVKTLVDEPQGAGYYSVVWDGRDEGGAQVPQGVYFCRLSARRQGAESADFIATRKLMILR